MNFFHWHPLSWYVEEVELVAALPLVDYGFKTTLRCKRCNNVRTTTSFRWIVVFKVGVAGLRDPSYRERALELANQIRDDVGASLI